MTDNEFTFKEAQREGGPVTIAIVGAGGSGKTYSALLLARGMAGPDGKIGLIDAEGGRSKIYADDPDIGGFYRTDLHVPFSSERYMQAVKAGVAQGMDVIIIDSASHEHEAEGGYTSFADAEEQRLTRNKPNAKGVSRNKWIRPAVAHNRFIRYAVGCPAHVIFCIREKSIIDMDQKPAKEIFVPVWHRGLQFEMTIVIRLQPNSHSTEFKKVPKPLTPFIRPGQEITVEHGRLIVAEANKGVAPPPPELLEQIAIAEAAANLGLNSLRQHFVKLDADSPGMRQKMKDAQPGVLRRLSDMAAAADDEFGLIEESASDDAQDASDGQDPEFAPASPEPAPQATQQPESAPQPDEDIFPGDIPMDGSHGR